MEVLNLCWPRYHVAAAIRIACALVSVPTAIFFARATPPIAPDIRNFLEVLASAQQQRDDARGALDASETLAMERKQAAKELATVNKQLHSVMDSISECILQIGHDWRIIYGNRQAIITLPDFCVGADFWSCFPALRDSLAERRLQTVMTTRSEEKYDNYYEPYNLWHRVYAFPTDDGISIFFFDITEEKKLNESLTAERLLKERHIESLSHMAGGLAHEISNPLGIIHARASNLQEAAEGENPPSANDVRLACINIVRTSDRAIRILRGLRGLSREASKDPMFLADILLICDECIELQQSRFDRHNIEMRISVNPNIPLLLCREVQIGQVVSNLLNNAFDAIVQSSPEECWISLVVEQKDGHAVISVTDSGPGISHSVRDHLMEPFFTTKGIRLGMGVGLSLSRAIAIDHGGALVLSEDTQCTCFQLILPIPAQNEESTRQMQEAR